MRDSQLHFLLSNFICYYLVLFSIIDCFIYVSLCGQILSFLNLYGGIGQLFGNIISILID